MITLRTMLAVTPVTIRKRASECRAVLLEKKKVENATELRFKVRCPPKKAKDVIIRMHPDGKAWVSCSCDYFLYDCEVALTVRGSSDIIYSDGRMPKHTNPHLKPIVCKHIVSCAPVALKER